MSFSEQLLGAAVRRTRPAAARLRRAVLVRRARVLAAAAQVPFEIDVALDARIGRGVRVEVEAGSGPAGGVLRIGPQAVVGDGVVFQMRGGTVELGGWSELRRGTVVTASGTLVLHEGAVIGAGSTLHCTHEIRVGARTGIAEYATLVDTSHVHTAPGRPAYFDTSAGRIVVGEDVFMGAKCTLTRGARVGDFCLVGAGSVVIDEVPARTFVSGVPARRIRDVVLPWEQ